jgi:hypothetical protein
MRAPLALATLVTALSLTARAAPAPDAPAAKPTAAQLQKERTDLAARAFPGALARFESGTAGVEDVARWSLRWLDAASDGATGKALAAALAAHADRMKDLEDKAVASSRSGRTYTSDVDAATYYRLEADLWVARGKR